MKQISTYIIEKLHLDKNINITTNVQRDILACIKFAVDSFDLEEKKDYIISCHDSRFIVTFSFTKKHKMTDICEKVKSWIANTNIEDNVTSIEKILNKIIILYKE